jgi:hypothetical protein
MVGDRAADRPIVEIAVLRAVEPDLEAVGVAGLGQQGLGRVRVVERSRIELRRVAVHPWLDDHPCGYRIAAHDVVPDGFDVDRTVDRLADSQVGEGVSALDVRGAKLRAALIEAEEDGPELHRLLEPHPGRAREPVELGERRVVQEVDLTPEQGGNPTRRVGYRSEHDPVDVVRVLRKAPPICVLNQHRAHARLVRFQRERAGAVGVVLDESYFGVGIGRHFDRPMLLRPGLGHDPDGEQLFRQDWIGFDHPDSHDMVAVCLDGRDRRQVPDKLGFWG